MTRLTETIRFFHLILALCFPYFLMSVNAQGAGQDADDDVEDATDVTLGEAVVTASPIDRVKRSAYNVLVLRTDGQTNSTKTISDMLAKTPGLKIRESGGVGSDLTMTLDGFSGKHVKIFIDGVPQEGVGEAFSLQNIPVNYAERIEVYKGVVPVGFGTDAIGGVVNVVTNRRHSGRHIDASYSFGSFNTHRTNLAYAETFHNGLTCEITAFQNYSDNDYRVFSPVEDFLTGRLDRERKEHVRRFNDTYHNEAAVAKLGVVRKPWADRLMLGLTWSEMYKEIQTGVRQEIVYGAKHRRGHAVNVTAEYEKRRLFVAGLDLTLRGSYNRDVTTNIDTASCKYNWRGETAPLNSPGEQSYLHSRATSHSWNAAATLNYRIGRAHMFTFNDVYTDFRRRNASLLTAEVLTDAIGKQTRKNIAGLQYRFLPSARWNVSAFGKHYNVRVAGPVAATEAMDQYVRNVHRMQCWGYGAAATWFVVEGLQAKLSYEKACRLPTIEEMFGDEDLETGDIGIRPERSHNLNLNVSWSRRFHKHTLYAEGALVFRDTKDYIQRNIMSLSGGKYAAAYVNYGNVRTKGYNLSIRYGHGRWLSIGGNLTKMDVCDNMPTTMGATTPNINYKQRISNLPYLFADSDICLIWNGCGRKDHSLSMTYDNQYLHSFTYYSSNIGANKGDYVVSDQFAHNLILTYSLCHGRYNLSVECRNFTDERLYDNFSLQKAGRAFYGKVRVKF